ncbi:MAG: hypothetical protein A3A97_03495 [Candidatus Terrybacteria bacterium RIFCSPLOWO2_01_FULL_40_23]|uniref:Penicillin-binding protein transpeptidase domain-containing protein n=1 Tax=Candidatus Terrybacteria bacterium RIFCSPLOWO2_01_FULL_40_23 TaxID=1802366 RepID=A0A1G2PPZ3_9BACT|nr:MAG: hypothetical protein A3A97_03495 [Candidatus Terrybacteria bacterium RIFCSPLOWO2_01_FULL_40_23]
MQPVRASVVFIIFIGAAAIIISRLFFLQVFEHDFYAALARGQQQVFENIVPERGGIFLTDKNNETTPLAVNKDFPFVYAVPKDIEDGEKTAKQLSEIFGGDEKEILEKLSKKEDTYEVLAQRINEEQVQKIKDLNIKGIAIRNERLRYYPAGSLASHVSGFVGQDEEGVIGRYGLEGFYEKKLRGVVGKLVGEKDARGNILQSFGENKDAAQPGNDLLLTIDPNIQTIVEEKLRDATEKWSIDGGTIIVMDPLTGAIRALANFPNFDLNNYSKVEDANVFANPAVSHLFEPGSVFKPITIAAGLDTKTITPGTTYENTGSVKIGSYTITNVVQEAKGIRTMTEVLEESLNTGVIFVEEKTGQDVFKKYVESFGMNEKTGIDIFGEVSGNISNLSDKRAINYATASFGQGIAITPIEMTMGIAAIANQGELMTPYVVQTIRHADGTEERTQPESKRKVMSSRVANDLIAMMVSVVRNGTGKRAQIPGYTIAGKTGTAQVPNPESRGYSDKDIHTFAGFFPAFDPRVLIFIKLDDPKGVRYAEGSAVPLFREIAEYLITYYAIPPDAPQN